MGNAPNTLGRDYTITAEVTIPSGGAEGMIVTAGGMSGGYGLMLSPGASWLFSSELFKNIGLGLLILGLLLLLIGTAGRVEKTVRLRMLAGRRRLDWFWLSPPTCSTLAAAGRCSCTTSWTWSGPAGKGFHRWVKASTPSYLTSSTTAPASPRAAPAC